MRIKSYKTLDARQREAVREACEQRNVECSIEDAGTWIKITMTGEPDAVVAAWAFIRAARNEHDS